MESIATTSAPRRSARARASRLLPEPVGPVRINASRNVSGVMGRPRRRKEAPLQLQPMRGPVAKRFGREVPAGEVEAARALQALEVAAEQAPGLAVGVRLEHEGRIGRNRLLQQGAEAGKAADPRAATPTGVAV